MVPPPKPLSNNNIVPLPPDFEPTPEEQSLLSLYATVKLYEKEAAKLKEKAAKAKLAAADERYQREKQERNRQNGQQDDDDDDVEKKILEKKKKKKKQQTRKTKKRDTNPAEDDEEEGGSDMSADEVDEDDDAAMNSDDSDDDVETSHLRRRARQEEIQRMRSELDDVTRRQTAEQMAAQAEEELRARHLQDSSTSVMESATEMAFSLKKKKPRLDDDDEDKPKTSLISSLSGQETPPHDFSKKLGMGKASLDGTILFPTEQGVAFWSPPPTATDPKDGALSLELANFDSSRIQSGVGNNTLAIKFMSPQESKRFSINLAGPGHGDYHNVLFHFNPRHHQKGGQLIINDKQEGIWGQAISLPLSQIPIIFGQTSCTLIIQIMSEGFDVFLQEKHIARLEHRTQLPANKCSLYLNFPSTDDYGDPENWSVYRVWWGHKSMMATGDLSNVAGVNVFSMLHPKKLFISGLTRISSQPEVDLRRAELERAFRKYGGAQGAIVTVPTNTTFAFVEVESERQADLALTEMASLYRMNRARRSKHEALQEERAKAEAAKEGKVTGSSEWD